MAANSETLKNVNNRLLNQTASLSAYPVFDPKKVELDVEKSIKKVTSIVNSKNLTDEDKELIKSIHTHAKVIYEILSERISMQKVSVQSLKVIENRSTQEPNSFLNDAADKKKTKGLTKEQLHILEGWFQENKAHPYSQKDQTELLMQTTKLTKSQVQNISNRRRKEKNAKISPELATLLS
ncbi:Mating-type-like protein ALPHA2 [Candida maltosa Xu316]|uniref:Mating-type-like protein ALPHA2 n=1 Tax=Candida maltosa (strain Xu316) TaxID=1245528 RepID=M3J392_CANMX|nr:Mating-type-like protein ALPHA2 [Candida maltosa Xu316]